MHRARSNDHLNTSKYVFLIPQNVPQGVVNEWYWLGGSDLHKEGEYVWWTSLDTPFANYTNWAPGVEPNDENNAEDCVNMWAEGTWNDQYCSDNIYYVCEYYSPLNC